MGIFDRFRRPQPDSKPLAAKSLSTGFLALLGGEGQGGRERLTGASTYADMLRLGYGQNATVRSCIDLIAQGLGSVNWLYYRGKGNSAVKALDAAAEELDELDDRHPIVAMLEEPNNEQARSEWLQQFVLNYMLAGNAYCYSAIEVAGSRPRQSELWWLDPDAVNVMKRERAGDPKRFEYRPNGALKQVFTAEQVQQIKAGATVDEKGVPPARAAVEAINQNNLARRWNSDLLGNSGRPSAVGKWNGGYELSDEQMQDRAQQIAPFFKPENAGKFLFTQFTDIQQFGMTPEQMGYLEGIKDSMREICRAFRVPPQLLGDNEASTYSNYKEARKSLYQEVIIPMSETLALTMQRWFRVWEPGLMIVADVDSIEALGEAANDKFTRANTAQFLTVDERRLMANYDAVGPEAGGDLILVPAGLVPLNQVALAASYSGDVMPDMTGGNDSEPEQLTEGEQSTDEEEAASGAVSA